MNEKQAKQLIDNLAIIKSLLAHQVAQSHETLEAKATALRTAGMTPKEIAVICGTTSGTIRVSLVTARKHKKNRKG